jgi:carbon dioxide concentrating mechanism protein CcmN
LLQAIPAKVQSSLGMNSLNFMTFHLPILAPVNDTGYILSGDVQVDESAGIAAGVLLQADPGSQIRVEAGVCIGMGSILHAHEGTIHVRAGATLGTGVLVVGQLTVGERACIGSFSTLWNTWIADREIIPPGSLRGDPQSPASPSVEANEEANEQDQELETLPSPAVTPAPPVASVEKVLRDHEHEPAGAAVASPPPLTSRTHSLIPGRSDVERLMRSIYPHRQLSPPTDDD